MLPVIHLGFRDLVVYRRLLLALFACLLATAPLTAETFRNPFQIPLPETPTFIGTGDFNKDGLPDFFYITQISRTLHVLLAQNNGTYTQTAVIDGNNPDIYGCHAVDLNEDHADDIVCLNFGTRTSVDYANTKSIAVYRSNGDGTFQAPAYTSVPSVFLASTLNQLLNYVAADINRDGHVDLVVYNSAERRVYAFLGDGNGNLSSAHTPATNFYGDSELAPRITLADVNGDGYPDALLSNNAAVYLGHGDGTFTLNPQNLTAIDCVFADFDRDGHMDALCSSLTGPGIAIRTIYRGEPTGLFNLTPVSQSTEILSDFFQALIAKDLNGDGFPDLVSLSLDGMTETMGQPGLAFSAPVHYAFYDVVATAGADIQDSTLMADYNRDGYPDLAMMGTHGIYILYGRADGSFKPLPIVQSGTALVDIGVSDFNRDGTPDVVTSGSLQPELNIGKGDGTFQPAVAVPSPSFLPTPSPATTNKIVTGDFDGDGNQDFLAYRQGAVYFYAGRGDGTFTDSITSIPVSGSDQPLTYDTLVADINHDGRDDLVSYGGLSSNGPFTINVFLSKPSGGFAETSTPAPGFTANTAFLKGLAAGDFDQDGNLDIAYLVGDAPAIALGHGDGTFSIKGTLTSPAGCPVKESGEITSHAVVVGDFDGDGHADIASMCSIFGSKQGELAIYYGLGNGFFSPLIPAATLDSYYLDLVAADLNHDGLKDFVLTGQAGAFVPASTAIVHSLPGHTFSAPSYLVAGSNVVPAFAADFNRDGYPDLLLANTTSNTSFTQTGSIANSFVILLNEGNTPFAEGLLTASPEPSPIHQAFTLTAAIQPYPSAALSGNVTFTIDGAPVGSAALVNNSAHLTISTALSLGRHALAASWPGDSTYPAVNLIGTHTVVAIPTTVTVNSSKNPSIAGETIDLTATLSDPAATGNVIFQDGTIGYQIPISGGVATLTLALASFGTHNIVATYEGDAQFASSVSAPFPQVVNPIGSTIQLTALPNPATVGRSVTLTATIANSDPSPTPATGAITFMEGSTILGTGTINAGVATLIASFATYGNHLVTAHYGGDHLHGVADSNPFTEAITALTPAVQLSSSRNPSVYGQAVVITATVSAGASINGPYLFPGTVTFKDGGIPLITVPIAGSSGAVIATFASSTLSVGTHTITAEYSGNAAAFPAISSPLAQVIQVAPSTTVLTAAPNPAFQHQNVSITATVSAGGIPTTGSIQFLDGTTTLGTVLPDASGQAVLTVSTLTVGTHNLTALYLGDPKTGSSGSLTVAEVIQPSDFTVTLNPSNPTLVRGHHATISVNLTSVGNFSDTMTFSTGTPPIFATAQFTSGSVPLSAGGTASASLYLDTSDVIGYLSRNSAPRPSHRVPALALLAAPLALFFTLRQRRLLTRLCLVLLAMSLLGLSGCSGHLPDLTPPGIYTIPVTVTGTNTHLSHTSNLTLAVTQ